MIARNTSTPDSADRADHLSQELFARVIPYTPVLWLVAAFGFFGLNGVFVYYALARPDVLAAAMQNPVSLVFMLEAFVMVAFLAWMIARLGIRKPGWLAFVLLSLAGGLAFSVPFVLLLHVRRNGQRSR